MPLYTKSANFRSARSSFRPVVFSLMLITILLMLTRAICQNRCYPKAQRSTSRPPTYLESLQSSALQLSRTNLTRPTVNLVIATVLGDDISWTYQIKIPNITVIRYIWDDPKSPYHPVKRKGREAMMYHTYFHDFYDSLPDISIFVHAHESPWHAENFLFRSLTYKLSRLDLNQVLERKYVNLRVGWDDECPNWINTTISEAQSQKQEEPYVGPAFLENFSTPNSTIAVPEIFAQPCCSQFAVTREAIRSVPKNKYARYIDWLSNTDLSDYISGRVWEHLWQYLFTGKAIDCPLEWKALCRMYGVCFEDAQSLERFRQLDMEKSWLVYGLGFWRELWDPEKAARERQRINDVDLDMGMRMSMALENGRSETWRSSMGNLYAA